MKLKTKQTVSLADLVTPVEMYLSLRDEFPGTLLFESADSHGGTNGRSMLCVSPLLTITAKPGELRTTDSDGTLNVKPCPTFASAWERFAEIARGIEISGDQNRRNGFYGFLGYDAVQCFEDLEFRERVETLIDIPLFQWSFFRFVIVFDHFRNERTIVENVPEGETAAVPAEQKERLLRALERHERWNFPFKRISEERANSTPDEYMGMVEKCLHHIKRGDVFQIVPSRRFTQRYEGDDFQVYRCLRSINPSPYLFYLDLGGFRLFGSSPEIQIQVEGSKACIAPIAGTAPRTGREQDDLAIAEALKANPKENAEHVMLVDLARNDLSRHCTGVKVEAFGEIHFYSHVVHLVSRVTGTIPEGLNPALHVLGDTFPNGTLSGAPKHRAMQILDSLEPSRRRFYGGAVGGIGLDGTVNLAIVIRSFLSQNRHLHYQAGAGIVFGSDPRAELNEVDAKLSALRRALDRAEEISR